MNRRNLLYASASLMGLVLGVQPSYAQRTAPAAGENHPAPSSASMSSATESDEIIVTGSKRAENVQDVPASIFVATSEVLERTGVRDFDQLPSLAPNLTVTKTSQSNNHSINMRGVGTYAVSVAVEPSVVVVVDDVPISYQSAAWAALPDAVQVEVLRGPQSTLFGKSASAGVVYITTASPTDHFTAKGETVITDDHEYRVRGSVAGPITDNLKALISANYSDYRGNIRNTYTRNWLNGNRDISGRMKIVWNPIEPVEVTLSPYYVNTNTSCCVQAYSTLTPGVTFHPVFRIPQEQGLPGIVPGPNNRQVSHDVDMSNKSTSYGTGLRVAMDIGASTLTSITSYGHLRHKFAFDGDLTSYNFQLANPLLPAGGLALGGKYLINAVTQELRLTSPSSGPFKYVAGLWYSHTKSKVDPYAFGSNAILNRTPPSPTAPFLYVPPYYDLYESTNQNYAAFFQGSYEVSQALTVIGGLRVTREDSSYTAASLITNVTRGFLGCSEKKAPNLTINTCAGTTRLTGRFGLQYKVAPDAMIFANYARGSKGQSFDLSAALTRADRFTSGPNAGATFGDVAASLQPVGVTTVDNYEVGVKWQLFGRALTWNTTAFYTEFRGFQAQQLDTQTLINRLAAVPKVTSHGIETEFTVNLPNFTLSGGGAYNKTSMDIYPGGPCYPRQTVALGCIGGTQDLSGKSLPNAPKWSMSLNGEYRIPMGGEDNAITLAGSYRWQSQVHYILAHDPQSFQSAYGIANASIGYGNSHYKIVVFVNNLFDKDYSSYKSRDLFTFNINPYGATPTDASFRTPARDSQRYFGVRASFAIN